MKKIPEHAEKVFEGVIFDVYQWDQEMYDGSTARFEALKRPDTAIVVAITANDELIVVEDEQPHRNKVITLPGGRVEKNEEPLNAAKRELLEETGYTSESWELWQSISPNEKISFSIHYFIARNAKLVAEPTPDAGEKISLQLTTVDQFLDDIVSGSFNAYQLGAHIMQQLLQGKRDDIVKRLGNHNN